MMHSTPGTAAPRTMPYFAPLESPTTMEYSTKIPLANCKQNIYIPRKQVNLPVTFFFLGAHFGAEKPKLNCEKGLTFDAQRIHLQC